jgi:hypothetical protein
MERDDSVADLTLHERREPRLTLAALSPGSDVVALSAISFATSAA